MDLTVVPGKPKEIAMHQSRLKHLYVKQLQDLYSAETQLVEALPKMAEAATSPELKAGFESHLEQTRGHVSRLEKIFGALGEDPNGEKCKGMEGLIKEGSEMIHEDVVPEEKDAGLIAAAQRVEHYEIAGYGTVATYAELLGDEQAQGLLEETLDEEKETDETLTELAEAINVDAAETVGDDAEDKSLLEKVKAKVTGKS
jgi:ferritin-like metal-binding protein YciE